VSLVSQMGWLLSLVLAAQPAGTIRGIVVDTRDGTGIRSVSVRLQPTGRTDELREGPSIFTFELSF
jgi:hypothetical protein